MKDDAHSMALPSVTPEDNIKKPLEMSSTMSNLEEPVIVKHMHLHIYTVK